MDKYDNFFILHNELKLTSGDLQEFKTISKIKKVQEGSVLLSPGADCEYLPFMLNGHLKVHRTAENGREIVLYHIEDGESCILSALGILNKTDFPASAVIEKSGDVILIPARLVKRYIDVYPGWRNYIFSLYNNRFNVVLELIDEVLFRKLDVRLARYLVNHKNESNNIQFKTHQDLADELGSSREVISRILKSFSGKDLISYERNNIFIRELKELKKICQL
ncbi:MAG: Crp/Fnr family transcriptional regulator [Spirochaetaceae bacterium]|jgi:CRP/FNR family transcriptional regulator|nr:Crp/Fnr family transcriptional regulator [Spirochaetaceae bacterium]